MKHRYLAGLGIAAFLALQTPSLAKTYILGSKGANDPARVNVSVQFQVRNHGFFWMSGRFDRLGGRFEFDESEPSASKISIEIDTASVNSNFAARDAFLRSSAFLEVNKYARARFKSTSIRLTGANMAVITGNLTFRGVTRPITIEARYNRGGKRTRRGLQQGFRGTASFALSDFGVKNIVGMASARVFLTIHLEGIRR